MPLGKWSVSKNEQTLRSSDIVMQQADRKTIGRPGRRRRNETSKRPLFTSLVHLYIGEGER